MNPLLNLNKIHFLRDWAAIILFTISPILQVFSTRSAIFFLFLSAMIVVIGQYLDRTEAYTWYKLKKELPINRINSKEILLYTSVIGIIMWCLVTLFWSLDLLGGAKVVVVVCASLVSSMVLTKAFRQLVAVKFETVFLAGVISGSLFLMLDLTVFRGAYKLFSSNSHIYDLNRTAIMFGLLIWPALAIIGFRTWIRLFSSIALFVLISVVIFSSESEAAQLELIVGTVVGATVFICRFFYKPVFGVLIIGVLSFPALLPSFLSTLDMLPKQLDGYIRMDSALHRREIWKGYNELIAKHPIAGWGLNSHKVLGEQGLAGKFAEQAGYPRIVKHPHNFILEIWLDLGAIGAILLSLVLLSIAWIGQSLTRHRKIVLTQTISAWYIVSLTAHGFTQSWWVATTAIAGIAIALSTDPPPAKAGGIKRDGVDNPTQTTPNAYSKSG